MDFFNVIMLIIAEMIILLTVYVMSPISNKPSWASIKKRIIKILSRTFIIICFALALIVATFALWLAFFSIQIADNDRVEWPDALNCPVKLGELQTIEDFFFSTTSDSEGWLARPLVQTSLETLYTSNRWYGIAAETSGPAKYARIRIQAIQNKDDESSRIINQVGAGGFFLRKGFFVYRFGDSFEDLFDGMQSGRVSLLVSIMPQGRFQYNNVLWANMFLANYDLKRSTFIDSMPASLTLSGSWTHIACARE